MAFIKNSFICPFCFEEHKISDIRFRCMNKRCKEVRDYRLTEYERGDLSNPLWGQRTFNPFREGDVDGDEKEGASGQEREDASGQEKEGIFGLGGKLFSNLFKGISVPKSAICPKCKSQTHAIVCPSCHNSLPESTLLGRDMIISVVGSRDTGKSHFVCVLINELRNRIAARFSGSLEGFDDALKRYMAGAYQRLYVDRQKLDLTQSSLDNVDNGAFKPLIFTLKLSRRALFGKQEVESFTFVFFDTAGEDLNDEATMKTVNKYICRSAGIIFLLDPLQIPEARNRLSDEEVSRASSVGFGNVAADDIMTRVSRIIRKDRKLTEEQKIDIPVAAVFSKFDMIASLMPEGSTVLETSPHCAQRAFSISDGHALDGEIRGLLKHWHDESFLSQLEMNYGKYSFFAVSALGMDNNPREDWRIDMPRPHRIEDPLLWILMERGVIRKGE